MESKKLSVFDKIETIQNYGIDLENRTIYVTGEITSELNVVLYAKLDMLKQYWGSEHPGIPVTEINLVVSSPGGDATVILAMVDFYEKLKSQGILVNVYVEGICFSAATLIVACASGKRTTSPRSRFMVHELQITGNDGTYTQTKSFQKELAHMQDEFFSLYAKLSLKGKEYDDVELVKEVRNWEKRCAQETYFSATEAVEFGLIDKIE